MAKQDLKEAAKILEEARKAQQFTLYESTTKKKPKPVTVVVAIFIGLIIAKYLGIW